MITPEQAHAMGAKGAEPTESERLLFEEWMRGHCWAVVGEWNGREYLGDCEKGSNKTVDFGAMRTRQLWAAWRDRAALGDAQPSQATVEIEKQEPVATVYKGMQATRDGFRIVWSEGFSFEDGVHSIYASPQPSQALDPLSDKQFNALWAESGRQYGKCELENVRLGWEMARAAINPKAAPQ